MIEVKSIKDLIDELGIAHKRNLDLSKRSPMKAGGICDLFLEPNSREQLAGLIRGLRQLKAEYFVVGYLSNVLFRDGRIRTPIIFTGKLRGVNYDERHVHVDAGCSLTSVATDLTRKGFKGFSGLSGFPATIGGALYMNASCYGDAISDHLEYVECFNQEGDLQRFQKDELNFSWRYSIFHELPKSYVILSATFKLEQGDTLTLMKAMQQSKEHRLKYQEHRLPNLGSTFATKNIYKDIANVNLKYRILFSIIRVSILWGGRILFPNKRTQFWALVINKFTQRYFGIRSLGRFGFSDHTLNCVVNRGEGQADEIIRFIKKVQLKLGIKTPIENVIMEKIE